MLISSLHVLLTYQCTLECDHCFVWGSPWQTGTLSLPQVVEILRQAEALGGIESIYFEGGEPFLYYATLLGGVRAVVERGWRAGVVTNAYWATSPEDAFECLRPFAGLLSDVSISSDTYHCGDASRRHAVHAQAAADRLRIPASVIHIAQPGLGRAAAGRLPPGESAVMFRGRAAEKLTPHVVRQPWQRFDRCPHEDLRNPGRLHVDPLGNVHMCQGLSIGNLFELPLRILCATADPGAHPILGPLLAGGPAELVRRYGLPHAAGYADACHLCDEARRRLRAQFPEALAPDQMYGVAGG
jgi:hypothetical protein